MRPQEQVSAITESFGALPDGDLEEPERGPTERDAYLRRLWMA